MDRWFDLPYSTVATEGTVAPYVENALFELKRLNDAINHAFLAPEVKLHLLGLGLAVESNLRKALL